MRHGSHVQPDTQEGLSPKFELLAPGPSRAGRAALLVPFGLRDGRMWSPDMVESGIACGCKCPACGGFLVAKAKDSQVRRAHFAHHHAVECPGGFESAVHKMAKQLIVDRLAVLLPAWDGDQGMPNPPVLRDAAGVDVIGRRVEFPARLAILASARPEERQTDYVPDVAADDEVGPLFIEIRVTHAVDAPKRLRIQSEGTRLIEIDLSSLRYEDCVDETTLAYAVLESPSNRVWLSCPDATDDWREAMRELKEMVRVRNENWLEQQRLKAEAIQRANQMSQEASERAALSKERYRGELRARFEASLAKLPELVSAEACRARLADLEARESDLIESLLGSITDSRIRSAVQDYHPDGWIYRTHPIVWQAEVYLEFIAKRPPGSRSSQREVAQWVRQEFGLEPELYELFRAQYAARSNARKSGIQKYRISAWYFTEAENRLIPNFYRPINAFVEKLGYLRAIRIVGSLPGEFEVL